eukprot:5518156-Amphidinium_carterae.1
MYQRDELFAQQLQEAQAAEPDHVGILRTELVSAQVNMTQMGTDRLRMTQRTNRLEQLEASAVEVEALVARERDALHNELMTHLQATTLQGAGVTQPLPPQQPPVVPQQQASSPAGLQASQTPQVIPVQQHNQPHTQGTIPAQGIYAGTPNHGMTGNPLDAARPIVPGMVPPSQGINPMTGQGYGYDPPTPMMTPGMASQATPSQHFSISTPPHPQSQYGAGGMQGAGIRGQGRVSPFTGGMQGCASTIGSVGPPGLGLSHVSGISGISGHSTPGLGCFGATATPGAGIAAGPSQGAQSFIPPGTPAPSMAGGIQHGAGGNPHDGGSSRFKATHAKLPKLDIRSISESSKVMLAVETWLWLCSTALNTWGAEAVHIWQSAATHAQAQHARWCSYTPSQRVLYSSSSYRAFSMSPPVGIVEAHIKSELFNSRIIPNEFVQYLVGAKRDGTLAEILEQLLQRYLPSEPVARVDALSALETPLKVAKSFAEALRVFRTWKEGAADCDCAITQW